MFALSQSSKFILFQNSGVRERESPERALEKHFMIPWDQIKLTHSSQVEILRSSAAGNLLFMSKSEISDRTIKKRKRIQRSRLLSQSTNSFVLSSCVLFSRSSIFNYTECFHLKLCSKMLVLSKIHKNFTWISKVFLYQEQSKRFSSQIF